MAISVLPYVGHLGFYYDDYSVLGRMHRSDDQSLLGLYDAVRPATGQRPMQAFLYAALYRLFGWHPLGYHISNLLLLILVAVLIYVVLRELGGPRLFSVTIPLVYSMVPHYATERFWLDAFQITLSTLFYLLSLYAGLRAARSSSWLTLAAWLTLAGAGIAVSLLAYEVIFPLFALNLGLIWWVSHQRSRTGSRGRGLDVVAVLAIAMLAVGLSKTLLAASHGQNGYTVGFQYGVLHQIADLVTGGIKVTFGTYLFAFPYVLWWIVVNHFSIANALVALGIGAATFAYLRRVGQSNRRIFATGHSFSRRLIAIGFIAFVLGYAIFLTTPNFIFRSAGIDNRINAAAALGVASMVVGGLALAARRLPLDRQLAAFSAGIACFVAANVFVVETLSSFWVSAADQQRRIVSAIAADASLIPNSGILILDGTCPEAGPTPIFADEWDLREALQFRLGDRSLVAAVAGAGMKVERRRLAIEIRSGYAVGWDSYPLRPGLVVFDYERSGLQKLGAPAEARRYVAQRPIRSCPPQRSFAWGFDPSHRWSLR